MKKKFSRDKKETNSFLIHGINGCLELLRSEKVQIIGIDIQKDSKAESSVPLTTLIQKRRIPINKLPREVFLKRYYGLRTQGIAVSFAGNFLQNIPSYQNQKGNHCLLIADNVEDPQNIGQIIRTAECAGIDGLVLPTHHGVSLTNSVMQVSQGAFLHLPIYATANIRNLILKLKKEGFWFVALENGITAKKWHEIDYTGKIGIIVGSEGKGIRPLVLKSCDFQGTIPMQGKTNSLNVSASVSAVLFERNRQIEAKGEVQEVGSA